MQRIEIPPKVVKDATAVAKAWEQPINKKGKLLSSLSPDDYQIQPGFLQNEDGTEVTSNQRDITSNTSGIICSSTKRKAVPWLREGPLILSTDELSNCNYWMQILKPTSLADILS